MIKRNLIDTVNHSGGVVETAFCCINPVGWKDEEFMAENSSEIKTLIERS